MLIDFRQLFPKWRIKPQGVLHVGANVGEECEAYLDLGITEQIWVEANPEIYPTLIDNVKHQFLKLGIERPGMYFANYCISDADGDEIDFHVSNNGSQSSSILELGTHKIAHPEVHFTHDIKMTTKRLDTLFQNFNDAEAVYGGKYFDGSKFDFLNLDLQGAELKALRGMGDLLYQFKWIYSEVNQAELYKGCPHVNDLDLFLNGFKFKRVETKWCGNTGWGDALYIKGR